MRLRLAIVSSGVLALASWGCGGSSGEAPTTSTDSTSGMETVETGPVGLALAEEVFSVDTYRPDLDVPTILTAAKARARRNARAIFDRANAAWTTFQDPASAAAARTAVADIDVTAAATPPEVAYAVAWILFGSGDTAGAVRAIDAAVARSHDETFLPTVRRELVEMHGVGSIDVDATVSALGANPGPLSPLLVTLANAYTEAAGGPMRTAALERALDGADPATVIAIRTMQAHGFSYAGDPAAVAAAYIELLRIDPEHSDDAVALAAGYYRAFLASGDERFRSAARDVYAALASTPNVPNASDVATEAAELETALPRRGGLAPDTSRSIVLRGLGTDVRGCGEIGRISNPNAAGTFSVDFVIAPDGSVTASSVASSDDAVQGIATCVAERVRAWRFVPRMDTRITQTVMPLRLVAP